MEWSVRHHATERHSPQTHTDTHLRHIFRLLYGVCVGGCVCVFLWYVNVPEGGFTSLHSPAPRISHQAVDNDAFEVVFSSPFQAESGF